jgi:hypothetical protein
MLPQICIQSGPSGNNRGNRNVIDFFEGRVMDGFQTEVRIDQRPSWEFDRENVVRDAEERILDVLRTAVRPLMEREAAKITRADIPPRRAEDNGQTERLTEALKVAVIAEIKAHGLALGD